MQLFLVKMGTPPKLALFATLLVVLISTAQAQQQVNPAQNQIESSFSSPAAPVANICRPDQVMTDGKCMQLRKSLSDLVREILENSDGSSSFLHYQDESTGETPNPAASMPESVPVSDLFIQNLAVISEANMSNCLALATCNEHCRSWPDRSPDERRHEEGILEKFIPPLGLTVEPLAGKSKDDIIIEDDDATGPDFVRTIMLASKKGIELAKNATAISSKGSTAAVNVTAVCGQCYGEYTGCSQLQYDYTTRINAIYRSLVEGNATLYDKTPGSDRNLNPEVLYYHYSMRFLDLANLTSCYAQVGCENSCSVYKATLAEESAEMVGPPPNVSPFFKEDAHKPAAIDTIHNGALIGYKLALEGAACEGCVRHYKDCSADKYQIARASSHIFGQ